MKVLLVGAGGFAAGYIKELRGCTDPSVTWEGVVDPYIAPENKEELTAEKIPVYATMDEFYSRHRADLAIICTPTFLHRQQSICALAHGSHVLCEKPVAPTAQEAEEMLAAEKQYGRFIAIGFQWSFSDAMQALKQDILDGALGAPLSFKTAISWPRKRSYFQRGVGWGGRISKDGVMILDSIASNACAHYLHNMLFLLGSRMDESAQVKWLRADCLRANAIENFDTCTIQMETDTGVKLYFAASHAAGIKRNPQFVYTFEKATVYYAEDEGAQIRAVFADGTEKCYGDPLLANSFKKLWDCVDAVKNGNTPICTVKTALPHTRLIEKLYREVPVQDFPRERVRLDEEKDWVAVDGLFQQLYRAYQQEKLLSELK